MALEQEALERCVLRTDGGLTNRSLDYGVLPAHRIKAPQSHSSEVYHCEVEEQDYEKSK